MSAPATSVEYLSGNNMWRVRRNGEDERLFRNEDAARAFAASRGWWNLRCWNGLSAHQQNVLIEVGTLQIGYVPAGECQNGAEVAIEAEVDVAPGPRFYCRPCAVRYLEQLPSVVRPSEGRYGR